MGIKNPRFPNWVSFFQIFLIKAYMIFQVGSHNKIMVEIWKIIFMKQLKRHLNTYTMHQYNKNMIFK